jgi:hypothetical protein
MVNLVDKCFHATGHHPPQLTNCSSFWISYNLPLCVGECDILHKWGIHLCPVPRVRFVFDFLPCSVETRSYCEMYTGTYLCWFNNGNQISVLLLWSIFNLLLWNHWSKWNPNWQKCFVYNCVLTTRSHTSFSISSNGHNCRLLHLTTEFVNL